MTPEQLKASILQRAMEGKLVPQDPNDEPASELLKKIKAEKEKLIKEGQIKRDKNETEIFRGDDGLHYEKFPDGSIKQINVPFEIPESWEWVNLGQVGTLQRGGGIKKSETVSKGVQCVRYGEIYTTYDYFFTETVSSTTSDVAKRSLAVNVNDILITLTGENKKDIGKAVAYLGNASCVMGGDLSKLSNHKMNAKYLSFILNSPNVKTQKCGLATGNIIVHISNSKLEKILVPIPPIKEQQEIVDKVEYYFKFVDEYEIAQNKLKKIINDFPEKLHKSILQYAMQGKLVPQDATDEPVEVLLEKIRAEKQRLFEEGKLKKKDLQESIIYQGDDNSYYEKKNKINIQIKCPFRIPKTWKWVKLKQVANIFSGFSFKSSEYSDVGVRIIRISDFNSDGINDSKIVRQNYKQNFNNFEIFENDILIAMTGGTVGKNILIPQIDERLFLNQRIASIRPYYMNHNFIFLMINSPFIQKEISLKKNSTNDNISLDIIQNFFCPLPPEQEQKRIVSRIKKINFLINKI